MYHQIQYMYAYTSNKINFNNIFYKIIIIHHKTVTDNSIILYNNIHDMSMYIIYIFIYYSDSTFTATCTTATTPGDIFCLNNSNLF